MSPERRTSRSASTGRRVGATRLATVATALLVGVALSSGLLPGPLSGPATAAEAPRQTTTSPDPVPDETDGTGSGVSGVSGATPLTVRLQSLSPGAVGARGPLLISGSVRNDSEETWGEVNVAPFVGDQPILSREELSLAVQSPEETAVGTRLDTPGTFASVGDLAPGDVVEFSLRVPRDELPPASAPGVYWVGAHALGTNQDGRDGVADGRARTFVPVLPEPVDDAASDEQQVGASRRVVPVSLVLPLRQTALRGADGSLADPEAWVDLVGPSGRLDRISRFAESAGDRPLTWLLDPAVLDAVGDLGQGNPSLSLGPTQRRAEEPEQTGDPSPTPSPSGTDASPGSGESASPSDDQPSATPTPSEPSTIPDLDDSGVPDRSDAASARSLLSRLLDQLADAPELLATPYADPDAMSLLRHDQRLLEQAVGDSRTALESRGLEAETVVTTPQGRADPALVPALPDDVGLVLSDQGDLSAPVSGLLDGRTTLAGDARTSDGGPAPTPALDPLALRQRILAETWLESTTATAEGTTPRPVVVVLPRTWDPGASWTSADFFDTLDVPWTRWATPPAAVDDVERELSYPASLRDREVDAAGVRAARELVRSAATLTTLLANDNDVRPLLTGAALASVSYGARSDPAAARASAEGLTRSVQDDLSQVSVLGTDFVTLSGGSGTLTVTVVNDLAQPVTVGVDLRADGQVRAEYVDPLELGPEQRVTVRLAISSQEGVHDVTLQPVTAAGQPAGTPFQFVLRTSQVGRTVWFVMAAGGLLFAVTLLRRVRERMRRRGQPEPEDA